MRLEENLTREEGPGGQRCGGATLLHLTAIGVVLFWVCA